MSPDPVPYRSTPIFDVETLPAALLREHRTKRGVWGVVRVLDGHLWLTLIDPPQRIELIAGSPGLLLPEQAHFVSIDGPMRMQIGFYDQPPRLQIVSSDQKDTV